MRYGDGCCCCHKSTYFFPQPNSLVRAVATYVVPAWAARVRGSLMQLLCRMKDYIDLIIMSTIPTLSSSNRSSSNSRRSSSSSSRSRRRRRIKGTTAVGWRITLTSSVVTTFDYIMLDYIMRAFDYIMRASVKVRPSAATHWIWTVEPQCTMYRFGKSSKSPTTSQDRLTAWPKTYIPSSRRSSE